MPDLVDVSSSFLTILYSLIGVAFIGAIIGGLVLRIMRLGPAGRELWNARRKRLVTLFRRTRGGLLVIEGYPMTLGGLLRRRGKTTVIPEPNSLSGMLNGGGTGIADAASPTTLPIPFLYAAEKFNKAFEQGRKIGGNELPPLPPDDLETYVDGLSMRALQIKQMIEEIDKIKRNDSTLEESITSLLRMNGIDPNNMVERKKAKTSMQDALNDRGKNLTDELKVIGEIKTIENAVEGFDIHWSQTKGRKGWKSVMMGIGSNVAINLASYPAWRISEANLDDLEIAIAKQRKVNDFKYGRDKYAGVIKIIPYGIFTFIVLLGCYIVAQGAHSL